MRSFMICTTLPLIKEHSGDQSRKDKKEGDLASLNENRNATRVLLGKAEGKRQLVRTGRRWKILLKQSLIKYDETAWTGFVWLTIGTSGRLV
jgi:hypothetical protein